MADPFDDLCPRPAASREGVTRPLSQPLWLSSVWQCADPDQADHLLGGETAGHVYQRDGHPNADALAERCRQLHGAEQAVIAASGMGALAVAVLSQLQAGDKIVYSDQLYGRSAHLLGSELRRLGIESVAIDASDLAAVEAAMTDRTRWIVVETIANPRLRVADIAALAELVHRRRGQLIVDNTFATPLLCRPLQLGADLVLESLTKMMNGHSDVVLGLLCGRGALWERVPATLSTWGLTSSPLDCWLAQRGLATLSLRMERAMHSALQVARYLQQQPAVEKVDYPGLPSHPDHDLATRQFAGRYGSIVTVHLRGKRQAATSFIRAATDIPFAPSLGEVSTTLSHPASTSHRSLTTDQRKALGIGEGTLRLSIGIESTEFVTDAIGRGLAAIE